MHIVQNESIDLDMSWEIEQSALSSPASNSDLL
jgi:hypothetical protein